MLTGDSIGTLYRDVQCIWLPNITEDMKSLESWNLQGYENESLSGEQWVQILDLPLPSQASSEARLRSQGLIWS